MNIKRGKELAAPQLVNVQLFTGCLHLFTCFDADASINVVSTNLASFLGAPNVTGEFVLEASSDDLVRYIIVLVPVILCLHRLHEILFRSRMIVGGSAEVL